MPNAALKLANGRQYVLTAEQVIDVANMNESGVAVTAIKLPYGAQVVGGAVTVDAAFDAATATLAVGDASTAGRYVAAANIAATGRVALVPTGFVSDGADIRVTPTFADPVTVGKVRVQVQYVISGRAHEVQPN
jgi:hypothetical protein